MGHGVAYEYKNTIAATNGPPLNFMKILKIAFADYSYDIS